jgi:hypothetical protein
MKEEKMKPVSRKKFLFWGIGVSSLLAIPAFFRSSKKETKTVKMLTQDGKLVSVEVKNLPGAKSKIKAEDIHTWVSKKKTSL